MSKNRPAKYTPELADLICELVASHSYGLNKICKMYEELPNPDTIYVWRAKYPKFSEKYAQAKLKQADFLAEEIIDIADDNSGDIKLDKFGNEICDTEFIARSRLRVDTRKWLASKLLPKQYGDKVTIESKEDESKQLREETLKLRAELDAKNKKEY